MTIESISVTDLFQKYRQYRDTTAIIDVREVEEFADIATSMAENFPLSDLDIEAIKAKHKLDVPLYLMCRSGKRSMTAAEMLQEAGYQQVYNVDGGILAWNAAGLPVVHGRR